MKYIWIQPNKIENVEGNWYLLLHQIKDIGKNIIFLLTNVSHKFWQNQIGEYVLNQNLGKKYFFILENTTGADFLPLGIKSRETFVKRLLTTSERNRSLIEWAGNRTNEWWKKTLSWKICFWDNTKLLLNHCIVKVVDHTGGLIKTCPHHQSAETAETAETVFRNRWEDKPNYCWVNFWILFVNFFALKVYLATCGQWILFGIDLIYF